MKILQSIFATALGLAMLFSSTGVRISQHWCCNHLVNATIWGEAAPCAHFHGENEADCSSQGKMKGKNCCEQRSVVVEGCDDNYRMARMLPSIQPVLAVVRQFESFKGQERSAPSPPCKFHNHSPPLIGLPLYLAVQSFLI